MRVFVGPLEVAGLGTGWVAGLKELGWQADLVCAYRHPFGYSDAAAPGWAARAWMRLGSWRVALPRRRLLTKALAFALQHLVGWLVLAWALRRYDAFVFLYGETITNTRAELALLRAAGKRVVVVFVGSDARPPYVDGGLHPADRPFDARTAGRASRRQQRKVARLERGATACINAPATAHFQRRPYVNWFAIGIARDLPATVAPPPGGARVRLLHSPSHPVLKGSAQIRAMVERLQAQGLDIELRTIQGRPNAEVLQALRDCDLVLDQLYSDTPMAGFAAEAAGLGRPVLVGGYRAGALARDLAGLPQPPTCYVAPEAFEAELARLVRDRAGREALGRAARTFVADHWRPGPTAERLARVLRGDVPAQWWCDPGRVDHLQGCGLPEAAARDHVRALVAYGGASALQLDDKPALRQAFLDFAAGGAATA
jgi:glycosyltransferase involved in cell wall biosynthesis